MAAKPARKLILNNFIFNSSVFSGCLAALAYQGRVRFAGPT
jgi:hypothetical protein